LDYATSPKRHLGKPDSDVSKIPITTPSNQVETTNDLEGPKASLYEADKSNNNERAANEAPTKEWEQFPQDRYF
jgi:hypothetical protein